MKRITKVLLVLGALLVLAAPLLTTSAKAEQNFTEYSLPTADVSPFEIVNGADGNLWFTERGGTNIGRVTLTGNVMEFPIPSNASALSLAAGPDDNVWFTEVSGHNIGKITPAGQITEYPIPTGSTTFSDIVAGPDGALWFSEWFDGVDFNLGRITTDGTITSIPTTLTSANIANMVFGSDGALWATQSINDVASIGRITTTGLVTEFSLPNGANPQGITNGPDGALWFTEYGSGSVGRITTAGAITHYQLSSSLAGPRGITMGTDGSLWFTEESANKLAQMSANGTVLAEYAAPTSSALRDVTVGSDGSLWFTAPGANSVGRFNLNTAATLTLAPMNGTNTVGATATFQAAVSNVTGQPVANATVRFVVSGSVTGAGICVTDTSGGCTYNYAGPSLPGADAVEAYVDSNGNGQQDALEPAVTATQAWLLPTTSTGQVTGGGHVAGSSTTQDVAFGFVAKSDASGVSGECSVIDPAADVKLHCADATVVIENGNAATIFGNATINGSTTAYRIDIQDNGTPGTGNDTFGIVTASGYRTGGVLTGGNLMIKQ